MFVCLLVFGQLQIRAVGNIWVTKIDDDDDDDFATVTFFLFIYKYISEALIDERQFFVIFCLAMKSMMSMQRGSSKSVDLVEAINRTAFHCSIMG